MNHNFKCLDADLNSLLQAMSTFSTAEVAEVTKFLRAGEYGLAFETLCGIVKEEGKHVPPHLRPKLRKLAEQMGIDPVFWTDLV